MHHDIYSRQWQCTMKLLQATESPKIFTDIITLIITVVTAQTSNFFKQHIICRSINGITNPSSKTSLLCHVSQTMPIQKFCNVKKGSQQNWWCHMWQPIFLLQNYHSYRQRNSVVSVVCYPILHICFQIRSFCCMCTKWCLFFSNFCISSSCHVHSCIIFLV